ncbi:hypothetical protein BVY04_05050 [bacterium M21]|nr:hypothetical protein BVY04_05050 [bacterium M21]
MKTVADRAIDAISAKLNNTMTLEMHNAIFVANGGVMPGKDELKQRGQQITNDNTGDTEVYWDDELVVKFSVDLEKAIVLVGVFTDGKPNFKPVSLI